MKKKKQNNTPSPLFRLKSCTGKQKYSSEMEAFRTLGIQRGYGEKIEGIRPYRCAFCSEWHLGHVPDDDAE